MRKAGCPFCDRLNGTGSAAVIPDAFPVTNGHVLIVPTSHVTRIEDLGAGEWNAVMGLVRDTAREIAGRDDVAGVNIGINSGSAAGQTVDHAHIHVIPRRQGDVPDPRGGVRWVVPEHADYWSGR